MLGILKSRIDKLEDKCKSLIEKREKTKHKYQVERAKISVKISMLQLKSFKIGNKSKELEKQLNAKIDNVMKEIEAENKYLKDHKNQETKGE